MIKKRKTLVINLFICSAGQYKFALVYMSTLPNVSLEFTHDGNIRSVQCTIVPYHVNVEHPC